MAKIITHKAHLIGFQLPGKEGEIR